MPRPVPIDAAPELAYGGACSDDHPCPGACVVVPHGGEVCAPGCMADAQCRVGEGYVCDADWHACLFPNVAAIVPRACPDAGPRDAAMSAVDTVGHGIDPAVALANDGKPVVIAGGTLARDARGTLYAVRCEDDVVLASSRDGGATWSAPVTVGADRVCDRPSLVVGKDALYLLYGASGLRVRASRDGGRSWTQARTPLPGRHAAGVVGSDGRLHVIALDGSDRGGFGAADQRVEYTVSADGSATFTPPALVSAPEDSLPYYFAIPRLALDDQRGWLYAAYVRGGRTGPWEVVLAVLRLKDKAPAWRRVRLGDGCALRTTPALALDPTTGALHVAWYDNRGGARFARAVCAVGLVTCTEVGRINDAAFAAAPLDPDRAGEQASLLVDDARRVIHAVWTQGGDFVHATAKLPAR